LRGFSPDNSAGLQQPLFWSGRVGRSKGKDRIRALDELHKGGIRTYAMIAPVLPGAEGLAELLKGKIDYALIDRMNYHYADWVYRKYGMEDKLTDDFFYQTRQELTSL